jgi:hypothetical protein
MHKRSQKCYISHIPRGGTPDAMSMKSGSVVYMVNLINSAKFAHCSFYGLNLARV